MPPKFTHLHTHSHYSLLDGLAKIDELLDYTKQLGMDSVALTDHGVLYGAVEFYKNQNWSKAKESFENIKSKYPEDRPTEIYLDRINIYLKNPPTDFDGVFRADFK